MSDDKLLSDYLLGECSEADRRLMETRIEQDPALRRRVRELTAVTERLEALAPEAWTTVAVQEPTTAPGRRRPALTGTRARWLGALAAVVLFAAGVGVGALVAGSGPGSSGSAAGPLLALRPITPAPPAATGVAQVLTDDRLKLVVTHLAPNLPTGYYEAWLMTSLRQLVPLAAFRVDRHGDAALELTLPAPTSSYRYLDISLQRVGAGTAHSRLSVLRGATAPG